MATITIIPSGPQTAGTHTFGPAAIATAFTKLILAIDRTSFTNPGSALDFAMQLSQDNGATWLPWNGCGYHRDSDPSLGSDLLAQLIVILPNPGSTIRALKGSFTINQTATLGVTATLS